MNFNFLCKCIGGSVLYGLETPTSDRDERGIYLTENPAAIVGLKQEEFFEDRNDGKDVFYNEFRKALALLRKSNSEMIEMLFNQRWEHIDPKWKKIQDNKFKLIDSEKLYSMLCSYMQGERKLANGERTGRLGGKRKDMITTFGYSPKNFVQLYRLAWAGMIFFQKGFFPVHLPTYNSDFAARLVDIKINPQNYFREGLDDIAEQHEFQLKHAFENRTANYTFDEDYANELCREFYTDILVKHEVKIKNEMLTQSFKTLKLR